MFEVPTPCLGNAHVQVRLREQRANSLQLRRLRKAQTAKRGMDHLRVEWCFLALKQGLKRRSVAGFRRTPVGPRTCSGHPQPAPGRGSPEAPKALPGVGRRRWGTARPWDRADRNNFLAKRSGWHRPCLLTS